MATTKPTLRNFLTPKEIVSSPRFHEATPSDTEYLDFVTRMVKVKGGAGDVKVTTEHGDDITIPFTIGESEMINVTKIWATGTTATGIWAYQ